MTQSYSYEFNFTKISKNKFAQISLTFLPFVEIQNTFCQFSFTWIYQMTKSRKADFWTFEKSDDDGSVTCIAFGARHTKCYISISSRHHFICSLYFDQISFRYQFCKSHIQGMANELILLISLLKYSSFMKLSNSQLTESLIFLDGFEVIVYLALICWVELL